MSRQRAGTHRWRNSIERGADVAHPAREPSLRRPASLGLLLLALAGPLGAQSRRTRTPIIDVHLHALPANYFGPLPVGNCARAAFPPGARWLWRGPVESGHCAAPLPTPPTDSALRERTLAILRRYDVIAVTSGPEPFVRRWREAAPDRIIPAAGADPPDSIRAWAAAGRARVLGELAFQYGGLSPADSLPEAYFALAEELDLPVALHVGLGPPGGPLEGGFSPQYRMRLSDPLLLEEVLIRHPKLRLYVMHAGWPMLDQMVGLLYLYPEVYVDVAVIDWFLPKAEFYQYLKRLVEAGFAKRIMFGSDQMIWPDAIPIAIERIKTAPFLTEEQKRDILFNNAVRFFRLDPGVFLR